MTNSVTFGPFVFILSQRLLLRRGRPVELGARAFDILANLIANPNVVVSKEALRAVVWPQLTVAEGSLRFHIASLRKALGDGSGGARYIATVTGRGYCFVAPISCGGGNEDAGGFKGPGKQPSLPARPTCLVGRSEDIATIKARLAASRFVTIVGMGGVGKTTIAVSIGHDLVVSFDGAVHLTDLGALSDPGLVAPTVASMLGLTCKAAETVNCISTFLNGRRACLILDTCEHVIDAAAELAVGLFVALPQLHVLVTSREPLNINVEHVYRLVPLAYPAEDVDFGMAETLRFPAVQLFLDRVAASGTATPKLDNAEDRSTIVEICRTLDGLPLAIEIAASRVPNFGLKKTADLIADHLALPWPARRHAPDRQRTLSATLQWSYDLLTDGEQAVLRRLAVLVSHFTIEDIMAIIPGPSLGEPQVIVAFDGLVAKSMVSTRPAGASLRYQLSDTIRTFIQRLDMDDCDLVGLTQRHALHYLQWLEVTGPVWPSLASTLQRSRHLAGLFNVRAALTRCLGPNGKAEVGAQLVIAAAPVLRAMSLHNEHAAWAEKALAMLSEEGRGDFAMRLRQL